MPPTTTASMLLKSWAMPPVSWPTASIFWTWRSWASAASRSIASAFSAWFASHSSCVRSRTASSSTSARSEFALRLAARLGILAKRLDRDDGEEDRAEADDDPEPAQIAGEQIGLVGEDLALLDPAAKRLALDLDDVVERLVEVGAGLLPRRRVEIADSGVALLGDRGPRGERELLPALVVELLHEGDALLLIGAVAHQVAQLPDLEAGELPVARVDIAVGVDILVEHEAGQRGFGARDVGADVSNDQRDFVRMALGIERLLARVVGEFDEDDHDDEHQRRGQACSCSSPSPPIEADLVLFPVP